MPSAALFKDVVEVIYEIGSQTFLELARPDMFIEVTDLQIEPVLPRLVSGKAEDIVASHIPDTGQSLRA